MKSASIQSATTTSEPFMPSVASGSSTTPNAKINTSKMVLIASRTNW
jgi:hypothetical protein